MRKQLVPARQVWDWHNWRAMFASSYGKMKEKNGMSDTKISQPAFASAIRIINLLPRALAARVTHTGLVRLARRKRCRGIHVEAVDSLCDSAANRFVLKATVYPSKDSAGFVGYGDADPSNVSRLVRGGEMAVSADSVSGAHWVFFLPAGEPLISTPPLTSVNGLVSSEADSVNCRRRSTSMPSALPSR